jgi:hypothetical protein
MEAKRKEFDKHAYFSQKNKMVLMPASSHAILKEMQKKVGGTRNLGSLAAEAIEKYYKGV